jgi:hypothetical protein
MKFIRGLFSFLLVLGLAGCGKGASIDALKSTIGMSKDQVESKFGKPESSNLESTDDHPGGYWVDKAGSGASCKLRFDLPPRVVGVDC